MKSVLAGLEGRGRPDSHPDSAPSPREPWLQSPGRGNSPETTLVAQRQRDLPQRPHSQGRQGTESQERGTVRKKLLKGPLVLLLFIYSSTERHKNLQSTAQFAQSAQSEKL